ncbi:DUF7151 family protein [Oceanospirillum sanctuarii]|uniref:DUF7151 family protein n=1 Tax=Oceanospirillum sanctuarii TaxID=1434821 RepID=UPI0011235297|nr:hypothetical protein [Oceanospirillum sanctuarii]
MRYSLKNPFYKSSLAIAVTGAILSGCGGGSDGGSSASGGQTTSSVALSGLVTGRVADGYIMGATAFLDIDGDKQLDSWEPSQKTEVLDTTDASNTANLGKFEVDLATWFDELSADNKALVLGYLQDAGLSTADGTVLTAGDLMSAFSVVVDIPAEAIDADKPTETIGSAIKLAAPPKPKTSGSTETDAETFISPITTVLDQKVTAKKKELKEKEALGLPVTEDEKDVTLLVSAAKKEVKTDLGLADDETSDQLLTGDYIDAKADATKSELAKKLHTVAKVTTTLLAKGVEDTTGGSTSATQLDEATRQAIIDAVTEKVLAQLKTIAAVSDKIVAADTSGTGDVSSIDINQISEKAQEVAAEDSSDDSDAASLTEVTVDQDEIEAAKAATEEAQQEEPAEEPVDSVLTAFLNDAPKQIVRGTADNTLTYRDFALARATATWGGIFGVEDNTATIWDTDSQQWVDVTVSAALSGTEQTLTFTPTTISTSETPVAESEETVQAPAAITADTPLTLTRTLSGTVTDLADKSIRSQVSAANWKNKITIGSTFTNGDANPQRARLVAQSNSSVTVKLADSLSYNGLNVQIAADGTVSFTDSANSSITSFITDTVTATNGAFTVPADIAARFNIPADQRDWIDVAGVLGYQLGKNPVIFDWFNDTAFDQIATQALSTDGLVSSPNLVASLSGDTVTVNAASLLIPEGYTLNSAEAVIPALYGNGDVLAVTGNTFTLDILGETARVTLSYTSTTEGAEDIIQTGYIHRGKNTAGNLVAGRDYKIRSKVQWNPAANEGTGAYEHALEVLLRESRFADLKAATLDGQPIIGTSETPADYQVEGIYRVYGPKTVAAGATPAFDRDGAGATETANISLPTVPTTNPAVLSSVTAGNIAFDGQKLTFTSLKAADAPNAADICFELSLTAGTDTLKKLDCAGKPSDTGSYTIDMTALGVNLRAFDNISITGLTLNESIDSVEVSQSQALSNANVLEKDSLAQKALMGENLYLTTHAADGSYTYLTVSYNPDTGLWNIIRKSSDGSDNTDAPVTSAVVSGGKLIFTLDGVESTLELNAVTTGDLTDVNWLLGGTPSSLTLQADEAAFITWKSEHAEKVLYSSLFRSTPFTADESTSCSGSGYFIESGFDLNGNKLLDENEIDTTVKHEVCDGSASINVVRLDGSTNECADVGGTRLEIGAESILLCNSDGTPRNYPQAKSLALGFGSWVNALESHAVKVSASVEAQTAELDALVSNDGIDTSMMGLQFAIHALDAAHRQFVQTASTTEQTYEVATLIPELDRPSDLVSLAGTVTVGVDVDGQPSTLTLTGFSAGIDTDLLDETNVPVTTTVTMDPMSVPALMAASSFSWTMANVIATANDGTQDIGQVTAASVQATLTTTNDIALVGQTAEAGLSSVSLDLGSETNPIRIETLNSPAGIASERVFTGSLTLNADLQQVGYLPSRKISPQTINLSFNGQLEYNGQTLDINLGLNAPQIYQMDLSGFDIALDELNTGEVLTGWKSVTAINGIDEYYYNAPYYSGTLQSLTRYEFTDLSGDSRSYALAVTGTGSYQVWRVQSTAWGQVEYDRYGYQTFSSLADAQKAVLASGLSGYSYNGSNSETQIWAYQRVYSASNQWDSLAIGGYYDLSVVSLPEVGAAATSYDLKVDYVEYDQAPSTRFDNHSLYTATAGFSLKNLKGYDAGGAPTVLPDVALTVEASRTSYTQGDAKFTLNFGGEELTARYHHWDLFADGGSDDITGSLMDFSFTDNNGGLIVMEPTNSVECGWEFDEYGNYIYQENSELACTLGASRFRLMVNGVDHGKVWQDMNGQWIAVLGDGDPNIDEKQQDEFVVYTPQ